MKRAYYTGLLSLCVLIAFFLVLSVDTSPIVDSVAGRREQSAVWESLSKLRVFLTFHVLFASLFCFFVGLSGLFVSWGPARVLWFLGICGFLLYYRLDPRYVPSEWGSLFRAICMLVIGVLVQLWFFRNKEESEEPPRLLRDFFVLVLGFFVGFVFSRLVTFQSLEQLLLLTRKGFLVQLLLYLSGFLCAASFFGPFSSHFRLSESVESLRISRKKISLSFVAHVALFVVFCSVLLRDIGWEQFHWLLLAPFVPLIMSVYAPVTWFMSDSIAQVFSPDAVTAMGINTTYARLYLGIFFLYLSLSAILLIALSIQKNYRRSLLFAAHAMLILYWLPIIWFAQQLSRHY